MNMRYLDSFTGKIGQLTGVLSISNVKADAIEFYGEKAIKDLENALEAIWIIAHEKSEIEKEMKR